MMKYFMKKIAITAIVCVGSLAPYSVYGSNNEEDKLKDGESLRFNTTQAHTPLLAQQPRDLVQLRMLEDEAPQLVRMLPQGSGGGGWPPRSDRRLFEAPDILSWFSQLDIDDFEPKDTAYNRLLVDFASDKLDNILEDANWLFNPSKKCKTCFQDNCFSMQLDESLGFKSIEDNQSFLDDKNDSDVVQFKRSQFEKLKILLLHPNDLNMGQNIAF